MNKIVVSLLFFASSIVSGQENSWSLQKCLALALQNNIEIKIQQLEIQRTQKAHTNPLLELFPNIGIGANHSYNFGSTIDPNTNNRVSSDIQWDSFNLNASVNILDFTALATARKNRIEIELAKANKSVIEYEYKMLLLEKYFEALYAQELIKILKEQFANTTFNYNRIEKEVAIGSKPQSDFYDMQFAFSQEQKILLETQQLFEVQKMQLFQLMNVANVAVSSVVVEPYFADDAEIAIVGQLANPKIIFAELAYKATQKEIAVLRSDNLPKLSAFYGFSSFYSAPINQSGIAVDNFKTQIDNNKYHQAGLQLTIPVFNGFRNSRRIAASKIESKKSDWTIQQEKIKIDQLIALEKTKQEHYIQLKDRLKSTFAFAEASFKTAQAKFTNGKTEAIIYTSIKNQLLASAYDLLKNDLQLQYISLKINLLQKNEF